MYREFLPYANFITANFVTAVFKNYYYNFAIAILWAIYFVSAFIKDCLSLFNHFIDMSPTLMSQFFVKKHVISTKNGLINGRVSLG